MAEFSPSKIPRAPVGVWNFNALFIKTEKRNGTVRERGNS